VRTSGPPTAAAPADDAADGVITDAVGNRLADGDTVTVIKSLNVKGSPTGIKADTKVRNIRLVDGIGDHDIDCKVDGIGPCSSSPASSARPDPGPPRSRRPRRPATHEGTL
jgi:uncharacterized Zn ribbon protein